MSDKSNNRNYLSQVERALAKLDACDAAKTWPTRLGAADYVKAARDAFEAARVQLASGGETITDVAKKEDAAYVRRVTAEREAKNIEAQLEAMIKADAVDAAAALAMRDRLHLLNLEQKAAEFLRQQLRHTSAAAVAHADTMRLLGKLPEARESVEKLADKLRLGRYGQQAAEESARNSVQRVDEIDLGLMLAFEGDALVTVRQQFADFAKDRRTGVAAADPAILEEILELRFRAAVFAIAKRGGEAKMAALLERTETALREHRAAQQGAA